MKKAPCGGGVRTGHSARLWEESDTERPLTLRSKVVTTEMQLDINVERLLLNRGCLTAHSRSSDYTARQASKVGEFHPRETEVRSGVGTAIGRAQQSRLVSSPNSG
jgi:hypothetical protein